MKQLRQLLHHRDLFSVEKAQSVLEVARTMSHLGVGAIIVLDGRKLSGLFSERDLMRRVIVEGLDPSTTPISKVMTKDLATVDENSTTVDAIEMMQENGCRHLPVMRSGHVVGMISMRDLMSEEIEEKTEELQHMRHYIHGAA
jgi:signal-transduction protein with cAMP-binding, CBS, and nucleotidyltransferase domain